MHWNCCISKYRMNMQSANAANGNKNTGSQTNPGKRNWLSRHSRVWMTGVLVLTDIFSFVVAFSLGLLFRKLLLGDSPISKFLTLWPLLVIFILVFVWRGLYPAVGLNPVDELRITASTTSLIFLILLAAGYWLHTIEIYSRVVLTAAWGLSLVFIQVNRWILRVVCRRFWGEPIVIIGSGTNTQKIISYLKNNSHLGMHVGMVLAGMLPPSQAELEALKEQGIRTALLVTPEASQEIRDLVINDGKFKFRSVILISALGSMGSLGVVAHDLEGVLGMEVRHNLLNSWQRNMKRALDLVLAALLFVLVSPILLVAALAIKLQDGGVVLFRQTRVGRNGREFTMWKFRTMIPEADQKLQEWLSDNPELENEWSANQKLKNDPRLTSVGRLLRIWSLDELPQLINVMRGDMSLVGPRPFFADQAHFYGEVLNLYYRVSPGMSGMWQVTGRNEATFADRVRLDEYYIRNWSIWLDIYIMLRTVWVIVRRHGAY
jgi:Undecaprenyl-phosphate galactose phosphotransferase WbaP